MKKKEWFKREFNNELDPETFPGILERLRGTPARLEEKFRKIKAKLLTDKPGGKWSIQENAGHLADLETLWIGRMEDFANDSETLREADLTNQKTDLARHNERPVGAILNEFRRLREELVRSMSGLTDADLEKTALHPRLQTPMKIIDLAYFVAEHDDHHLAQMTILAGQLSS